MKGIILKDFYESIIIRKNLLNWIFATVMIVALTLVFQTRYVFVLFCGVAIPILGTSMLQFSMEQDEIAHFYKLQRTFPLTVRQIVLAKYILALLCTGFFLLVSLGFSLIYISVYKVASFTEGMQICAMGIPLSLTFMAVTYFGYFLFGAKLGTILYVIVTCITAMTYAMSALNFNILDLLFLNRTLLFVIGLLISIVLLVISFFLSVHFYERKLK